MKLSKVIAIPALALAAGLSLAACGSNSGQGQMDGPVAPPSGYTTCGANCAPAPKTLTRIQKTDGGGAAGWDTTWYHNYWSGGSVTTCTVTDFPDGATSATGNCAPDGVANGMTGGNVPAN